MTTDELTALRAHADASLPAYPGDTERLMTVPAPTMLRLLATIDARDSALNHERVISADLRENLKASQAHHAAADEEIERLRLDVRAFEGSLEQRIVQLEAALREIAMLDYEGPIVPGSYLEIARAVLDEPEADAPALTAKCLCTMTHFERQENRACPVHFPVGAP